VKGVLVLSVLFLAFAASVCAAAPVSQGIDIFETRSELLMDATNYTGVPTPEAAAAVWAKGLQNRSAAMQYTVMTQNLKDSFAGFLDALGSNWVTGQSSPSVLGFEIANISRQNGRAKADLEFKVGSPSEPAQTYNATLWLVNESGFWRIEKIAADPQIGAWSD
jgi:opacity protein-like surface antigen